VIKLIFIVHRIRFYIFFYDFNNQFHLLDLSFTYCCRTIIVQIDACICSL
jgi:hypothetical protein